MQVAGAGNCLSFGDKHRQQEEFMRIAGLVVMASVTRNSRYRMKSKS
jgi:hypothetical protein